MSTDVVVPVITNTDMFIKTHCLPARADFRAMKTAATGHILVSFSPGSDHRSD